MQGILAQRKQSSGHDDGDEAETPEPPPKNPAATAAKKPVRKKLCKNGPLKKACSSPVPHQGKPPCPPGLPRHQAQATPCVWQLQGVFW